MDWDKCLILDMLERLLEEARKHSDSEPDVFREAADMIKQTENEAADFSKINRRQSKENAISILVAIRKEEEEELEAKEKDKATLPPTPTTFFDKDGDPYYRQGV